jgi:hypothetical protein
LLCSPVETGGDTEVIGLLPVQDRLDDLRKRLHQIENLIEATGEGLRQSESAWTAELGCPLLN